MQVGRLNHVAIAVPDLAKAAERYRAVLGAKVSTFMLTQPHSSYFEVPAAASFGGVAHALCVRMLLLASPAGCTWCSQLIASCQKTVRKYATTGSIA